MDDADPLGPGQQRRQLGEQVGADQHLVRLRAADRNPGDLRTHWQSWLFAQALIAGALLSHRSSCRSTSSATAPIERPVVSTVSVHRPR